MRQPWGSLIVAAALTAHTQTAAGQSAFAICADSIPNRIVSTGPVRAVIATVDTMRVCLAVEGFTDSAPLHPRDWANPSRLVILETRIPGDARRMQETQILTSWMRNEHPLPNDSTAVAWRATVLDLVAAKWDVAARRMERHELEQNVSGLLAQKTWILAQIDTVRRRDDSLRLAVSEGVAKARFDQQRSVSAAQRYEAEARASLSNAQSSLAAATSKGDPGQIQAAQGRVSAAEDRVRAASDQARVARARTPDNMGATQDLIDRLDAKGRTATLTAMLADLDVDNRVASWRAALEAIGAQPDPEVRLTEAAAKLRAILAR